MPQMQKWTCLRGSEWTPFVDVFFMHQRVETRQLNQRYLTAIRTYFTRWLIRTNLYDLTRTILYDLSKPQWRVDLGAGLGVGNSYKFIRIANS